MSLRLPSIAAASALIVSLALPAAAQSTAAGSPRRVSTNWSYYELPTAVPMRPGTLRILKSRCDLSYPMEERSPCDTATGGPSGGRGS